MPDDSVTMTEKLSKSSRGGFRIGAGRKPGVPNKVTREIGAAAREFTDEALEVLASLMRSAENEAVRKSAATELIDRGHGRATQSVTVTNLDPEKLKALPLPELLALREKANSK